MQQDDLGEDEGEDGEYETADSGVSEQSSNGDEDRGRGGRRRDSSMEVDMDAINVPDEGGGGGADSPDNFRGTIQLTSFPYRVHFWAHILN